MLRKAKSMFQLNTFKLPLAVALVAGLALGSFLAVPASVQAAAKVNKYAVAVIIGNKTYRGKTPPVDFAHNDADAMKRYVLEVLGFREGNIIDLRDASKAELESTFGNTVSHQGKLFDWVRPGKSDVFIFYSGHGVPGLKDKRPYLLPVDGNANQAEISGLSVDTLYQNLAQVPARSMTVLLDACFSGETPKGMIVRATSGLSISAKLPKASNNMTVLTAAQGDQLASWDEEAQHGLFTRYVLDALYGAADGADYGDGDGAVTLAEVQTYLDDEMSYRARRIYGRQQTASVIGDAALKLGAVVPGGRPRTAPGSTTRTASVQRPAPPAKVARPQPVAPKAATPSSELEFWNSIKDSRDPAAFQAYLSAFPNGVFVPLARLRLSKLSPRQPTVQVARRTSPAPSQPASTSANRKLGNFQLNLITHGGADVCEYLNAYIKVFVSQSGFKGKGHGVMGISGKFGSQNGTLDGEFYSTTMTGEFKLKFDGREWSGRWDGTSSYNGLDCEGKVTLTRK